MKIRSLRFRIRLSRVVHSRPIRAEPKRGRAASSGFAHLLLHTSGSIFDNCSLKTTSLKCLTNTWWLFSRSSFPSSDQSLTKFFNTYLAFSASSLAGVAGSPLFHTARSKNRFSRVSVLARVPRSKTSPVTRRTRVGSLQRSSTLLVVVLSTAAFQRLPI